MKVAVVIDTWFPHVGGGQINALEISKRLAKNGIEIDIITRNNGIANLEPIKNLKVIKIGSFKKPHDLASQVFFCLRAFTYIYSKDYDLIHAHAFWPGITGRLAMVTKSTPSIFTVHGTSIDTKFLNPIKRFVEKFILTQIVYSAQITVSRDFLKSMNINKKIVYIPNGVDSKKFTTSRAAKQKTKTMIFVGRLHPQKNLVNLVKSIKLINQHMTIRLIIAGDGPLKQELRNLIKKESLSKAVKMAGALTQDQLGNYYTKSHLFILPSIYEGFPITLLEAWAAKLPVVVTKTGECQFLVKNGRNGYIIDDPSSPEGIAKTVIKAFSNEDLEKLGLAGYNLVKSRFTWEKAAQATLKVYEKFLKAQN